MIAQSLTLIQKIKVEYWVTSLALNDLYLHGCFGSYLALHWTSVKDRHRPSTKRFGYLHSPVTGARPRDLHSIYLAQWRGWAESVLGWLMQKWSVVSVKESTLNFNHGMKCTILKMRISIYKIYTIKQQHTPTLLQSSHNWYKGDALIKIKIYQCLIKKNIDKEEELQSNIGGILEKF